MEYSIKFIAVAAIMLSLLTSAGPDAFTDLELGSQVTDVRGINYTAEGPTHSVPQFPDARQIYIETSQGYAWLILSEGEVVNIRREYIDGLDSGYARSFFEQQLAALSDPAGGYTPFANQYFQLIREQASHTDLPAGTRLAFHAFSDAEGNILELSLRSEAEYGTTVYIEEHSALFWQRVILPLQHEQLASAGIAPLESTGQGDPEPEPVN